MQNKRHALLVGTLLLLLTGCHETFQSFFDEMAREAGWTREQTLVARYDAYKLLFLKEKADKSGYDIFYSRLSNAEVLAKVDELLKSIDQDLSYKNELIATYIDKVAHARPFLEKKERVLQALYRRLKPRDLQNDFNELMGVQASVEDISMGEQHLVNMHSRYAPDVIFVSDPRSIFTMDSEQVSDARKHNRLHEVETLLFNAKQKLAYKESDPADPRDPNKFLWRERTVGLELKASKIYDEKTHDNEPHYIEGHRIYVASDTTGTQQTIYREVLPAVVIYYNPEQSNGVLVIDEDLEIESGYGIPDEVRPTGTISDLASFATQEILPKIFPIKAKERRIKPEEKSLTVEIAPLGEPVDVWEPAQDSVGWKVSVPYMNERRDNYHVKLSVRMPAVIDPGKSAITLSTVKKEWHGSNYRLAGPGAVVEYYRLKPPYDGELSFAKILHAENTKRILFVLTDGNEVRGMIISGANAFVEEKPYAIEYTDSDIRWRLESSKRDGIYDKRKKVAPLRSQIVGEYETNGNGDHSGH